jgi:hypothetical protein
MNKLVFEFQGGSLDGQWAECDMNRPNSNLRDDLLVGYWFDSRCGTPGQRFSTRSVLGDTYEVTDRIEGDEFIVVQARIASAEPSGARCL